MITHLKPLFYTLFLFVVACQSPLKEGLSLQPKDFAEKMKQNPQAILIDVRTAGEVAKGTLANAQHMDINSSDFEARMQQLDKNKMYLVFCLSGSRSASAVNYMLAHGFKQAFNLQGGLLAWQSNQLPIAASKNGASKQAQEEWSLENYQKLTLSETTILVDFYAPWCAPCKKMEPILSELAAENPKQLKVIRINIDENPQLANALGIQEIPIVKVFKKGKETWTHLGFADKNKLQENL
jgi:thioredoxin